MVSDEYNRVNHCPICGTTEIDKHDTINHAIFHCRKCYNDFHVCISP
jgi:ribosomal protein L37AE/L43A